MIKTLRCVDRLTHPPIADISPTRRAAMACPALPTCGLAITEAERVFPQVISELEDALDEIGIGGEGIVTRMTGCPNGCARPYVAEIAFVGRSLDKYSVFLGKRGRHADGEAVLDLVAFRDMVAELRPVLAFYVTRITKVSRSGLDTGG